MLTNATIDKLIEMKLTAMADALRIQLDDPKMNEVNFEDRFSMLVDIAACLWTSNTRSARTTD